MMGSLDESKKKQGQEQVEEATVQRSGSNFIAQFNRRLASTEFAERNGALQELVDFITVNQASFVDQANMMLLWKGIFYAFWLADKPLYQQDLADSLAEKLLSLPTSLATVFLHCFWQTLILEWFGIDRHRLDKYLLLQRRFVNATFRFLHRDNFQSSSITEFQRIYSEGPLHPTSPKVSDSIRYHVLDLYFVELGKALPFDGEAYPLMALLEPVKKLLTYTNNKAAFNRIQKTVFEPLVSEMKDNVQFQVFQVAAFPLAQNWFSVGAEATTSNRVRRFAYQFVDELSTIFDLHSKDFLTSLSSSTSELTPLSESQSSGDNTASSEGSPVETELPETMDPVISEEEEEVGESSEEVELHEASDSVSSEDVEEESDKEDLVPNLVPVVKESSELNPTTSPTEYLDEYSGFRVTSLDPVSPAPSEEYTSTHNVYVEDMFDPSLPPDKKKVRWVLERNCIKRFSKNNALTPRRVSISESSSDKCPLKGLLKQSPIPIRLNRGALTRSELGLPRGMTPVSKAPKRKARK